MIIFQRRNGGLKKDSERNTASLRIHTLHRLKGKRKGIWSIKVNGNWRITFKFEDGDA